MTNKEYQKPKINILMATYNGEQYIESQLCSIISQTFKDWNLIIHDDGSTDKTLDIIHYYKKLDTRIFFIEDEYKAHNAGKHFMYMLHFAQAPFICFCDQDDIWLENKLQIMFNSIKERNNNIPQVVFSDAYLYHSNKNKIDGKLLFTSPSKLKDALFTNGGIHGSASIFNLKMKNCIDKQYNNIVMHDHILTLAGCTLGEITYLKTKLFLYRQHSHNVTGNISTNCFQRIYKAFFKRSNNYTIHKSILDGVNSFYTIHKKSLKQEDIILIENFLSLPNKNIFSRSLNVAKFGYTLSNSYWHLWIKILTHPFLSK